MKLPNLLLSLAVLVALTLTSSCSYSPDGDAMWTARSAVKERLKSPASAKFSRVRVAAKSEESRLYIVSMTVDSQNGFGAYASGDAMSDRRVDRRPSTMTTPARPATPTA